MDKVINVLIIEINLNKAIITGSFQGCLLI